jgi:hypothetical protein
LFIFGRKTVLDEVGTSVWSLPRPGDIAYRYPIPDLYGFGVGLTARVGECHSFYKVCQYKEKIYLTTTNRRQKTHAHAHAHAHTHHTRLLLLPILPLLLLFLLLLLLLLVCSPPL